MSSTASKGCEDNPPIILTADAPSASGLDARVGELLHRHRERNGLSAPAVVPDARPRRRRRVAGCDRRRGGGREQHPEDRFRSPRRSDGSAKRLVLAGYGLSSMVRPFIALASSWLHVLVLRFTDRLGKGIRTSPRDAMLATFADSSNRGKVFGFHRAMDHAGGDGPLVASAFLYSAPPTTGRSSRSR